MGVLNNIICIDFNNLSIARLELWLSTTNFITDDNTRNYIRNSIRNEKNDSNQIQVLYIVNNVIIGKVFQKTFPEITFNISLQNKIKKYCEPIKIEQIELYRSVLIDWIFNSNHSDSKTALGLFSYRKCNLKLNNCLEANVIVNVTAIDVEDLGFTLKELFIPSNPKWQLIINEFKKFDIANVNQQDIKLTTIYILDKYIIGYNFKMLNNILEHFFWNVEFENLIPNSFTFSFDIRKDTFVDEEFDERYKIALDKLSSVEKNRLALLN